MIPVLRNYQHDAVESVFREWEKVVATMIVLFTGGGKTVTFCEIVRRMLPKRSIIIAHRSELIHQACAALARIGIRSEIEMAEKKSDASMFHNDTAIAASVQSLISGPKDDRRMNKFNPDDFGLLVCDEFHHGPAASYKEVMAHFRKNPNLKILGVTATPDRFDEKALGAVCDSVAFKYDIAEGVEDGWLVPIDQKLIRIGGLDYSGIRTTAGDLNGADLARVMEDEKNIHGVVGASIELIGNRPAIAFTSSVRHAEMCCDIFNRHRPGMAAFVCGSTPEGDRTSIFNRFKNGELQVIANVGIVTEGTDLPRAEVIVMARPTKSRALYTQCVGRGLRPLPGIIDGLTSSFERREAISDSPKPACLVLDFVGNSGKHKLMTTADILGGKYDDETKEEAIELAEKSEKPIRMTDALAEAERLKRERIERQKLEEIARKAKLIAKVHFTAQEISPFDAFQITEKSSSPYDKGRPISDKQRHVLMRMGVDPDETNPTACRQILHEYFERKRKDLATLKQCKVLLKHGYNPKKLTFSEASQLIESLAKNNWKRPDILIPA